MADSDLVAAGLPQGATAQGGQPAGDAPTVSGPETPDQEAQGAAQQQQTGKQVAAQQQQAFDTMRSRRAFVAGLLAQGGNPQTALTQASIGSQLQ